MLPCPWSTWRVFLERIQRNSWLKCTNLCLFAHWTLQRALWGPAPVSASLASAGSPSRAQSLGCLLGDSCEHSLSPVPPEVWGLHFCVPLCESTAIEDLIRSNLTHVWKLYKKTALIAWVIFKVPAKSTVTFLSIVENFWATEKF